MTAMNQLGPQRDQRFLLVATLLLGFAAGLQPGQAPQAAICLTCEATPVPDVPTYIPPPPPMVALQFDQCIFSDYSVFSMVMEKPAFTNVIAATANGVFKQMRNALGVYDRYQSEANRTDREPFLHPALWPNLDIRIEDCVPQEAGGYGTNVAVWFEQPGYYGSTDTTEARSRMAKEMNYREVNNQSGQVGIHIDDRALQSMLSIAKAITGGGLATALLGVGILAVPGVGGLALAGTVAVASGTVAMPGCSGWDGDPRDSSAAV